jgi:hypothetical protein
MWSTRPRTRSSSRACASISAPGCWCASCAATRRACATTSAGSRARSASRWSTTPYLIEAMTRAARWRKWNAKAKERPGDPECARHLGADHGARARGDDVSRAPRPLAGAAPLVGDQLADPATRWHGAAEAWLRRRHADLVRPVRHRVSEDPGVADARGCRRGVQGVRRRVQDVSLRERGRPLGGARARADGAGAQEPGDGAARRHQRRRRRAGKTLLADGINILATGVSAPAIKYAETDEEFAKVMLAVLAEGNQVVLIDNVTRPLDSRHAVRGAHLRGLPRARARAHRDDERADHHALSRHRQ